MEKKELLREYGNKKTGKKCKDCGADLLAIPPFEGICPNCDIDVYKYW